MVADLQLLPPRRTGFGGRWTRRAHEYAPQNKPRILKANRPFCNLQNNSKFGFLRSGRWRRSHKIGKSFEEEKYGITLGESNVSAICSSLASMEIVIVDLINDRLPRPSPDE